VDLVASHRIAAHGSHQQVDQRVALVHPAGHRRAIQLDPVAGIHAALAVQRLMVAVRGDHHVGHQRRPGQATADRPAGSGRLEHSLAAHAGQLRAHMAHDLEAPRHVLQLLGDVTADLAQPASTLAAAAGLALRVVVLGRRLGAVHMRFARQVLR
jgi:hypothetical protein